MRLPVSDLADSKFNRQSIDSNDKLLDDKLEAVCKISQDERGKSLLQIVACEMSYPTICQPFYTRPEIVRIKTSGTGLVGLSKC